MVFLLKGDLRGAAGKCPGHCMMAVQGRHDRQEWAPPFATQIFITTRIVPQNRAPLSFKMRKNHASPYNCKTCIKIHEKTTFYARLSIDPNFPFILSLSLTCRVKLLIISDK
jgi:hypothetical protein